jgi:hypothetical protein
VQEAIDIGSNYYTIAYAPVDRSSSSAYRKIHVDVDQPGLHLTYRPGYYMDSSGKSATPQGFAAPQGQAQNGAQATRPSAMRAAMVRGSATPTQIIFKTQVVPSAGTEDTLPPGNKPITAMMKPPYRHYTVYYLADISNIAFATAADGSRRGNIEFAAVAFNADGDVINAQTSPLHANIPAADFQTILKSGMQVNLNIDVPAKGEYYPPHRHPRLHQRPRWRGGDSTVHASAGGCSRRTLTSNREGSLRHSTRVSQQVVLRELGRFLTKE